MSAKPMKITETEPTTIVKDFDTFTTYIKEHTPSLARTSHFLTKKTFYELDQLMSNPDPENTPKTSKYFYPLLTLFYYVALQGNLLVKTAKLQVHTTERLTEYHQLTPPEKYFFLLETFWVHVCWAELLGSRSSELLVPKLQLYTEYFASMSPGDIIFIEGPGDPLQAFRYNSSFLKYLSYFGLLKIDFHEKEYKIYEERQIYAVNTMTITDMGGAFLPILDKERNLLQWNIPYKQEMTGNISFPGLKDQEYEPFIKPFQPFFKGALQKMLLPPWQYKEGTFTFNVFLRGGAQRTILISSENTLEDLHEAIQDAFDFGRDHLYAFFMDGKPWSPHVMFAPGTDEGPYADQVRIGELGLSPGQCILYLFDFGSEWRFKVEVIEISEEPGPPQPEIIKKRGKSPEQYRF